MKILVVNRYIEIMGGVERYLTLLCSRLPDMGIEVDYLFGEGEAGIPGTPSFEIPELWESKYRISNKTRKHLDAVLKASRPDIIYSHNVDNRRTVDILASYAPLIRYVHGHKTTCPDGKRLLSKPFHACRHILSFYCMARAHYRFCMPRSPIKALHCYFRARNDLTSLHHYSKILVASEFMKTLLVSNGVSKETIEVLPCFHSWPIEGWSKPENPRGILFVGRLAQGKGLLELLEWMAGQTGEICLDVVGDGALKKDAEKKCRDLDLESRVTFFGWLEGEALKARYRHNAVLVLPSLWPEPFGIVGLEAAALCRPAVAFDVGGVKQWLQDGKTGYVVAEGDFQAMGEKLQKIIRDSELNRTMGVTASVRVASEFGMDRHLKRLRQVFQEVEPSANYLESG